MEPKAIQDWSQLDLLPKEAASDDLGPTQFCTVELLCATSPSKCPPQWRIQGRGRGVGWGGGGHPHLFLYQTEARSAEKNFFETIPPLSEGLDPPLHLGLSSS